MAFINVGRGTRDTGDGYRFMKGDNPIIMTKEPELVEQISTWHTYDIVMVKGIIATRTIMKPSFCPYCKTKNAAPGALVYVYPVYAEKRCHLDSADECIRYLSGHREISNIAYVFGRLVKDPQQITTRDGLKITQYPIEMYRKVRIRYDDPSVRADFPWVKSYGKNAEEDMKCLIKGSEIYVDGCLQTRSVQRHIVCGQAYGQNGKAEKDENGNPRMRVKPNGVIDGCGRQYEWMDRATEIVPYEVEYLKNYNRDIEEEEEEDAE
jgi:hypothetical protein